MDDKARMKTVSGESKSRRVVRLKPPERPGKHGGELYLGIDIGSTSSDMVVLDAESKCVFCDYKRTMGRSVQTVYRQLSKLIEKIDARDVSVVALTGAAGRAIARLLDVTFVNEVLAQVTAMGHLYPELDEATLIEMGGQDSKLVFLRREKGRGRMRDFSLNTVCAAGTGSFLDQQADRLGVKIEEEFGQLALQSKNPPRIAGRCSVFAKTDMIHLQQQATPMADIIAGLCLGLARNLKSNLGCGREFIKPVVFTGGVAANIGVARALEEVLDLAPGELIVPELHFFTGAIGAALVGRERSCEQGGARPDLLRMHGILAEQKPALEKAARLSPLPEPVLPAPKSPVYEQLLDEATEPINAYLGVDVGSISTNVVVIDEQKRVLAKAYLMTAGRPLEAVKTGLRRVTEKVAGKVKILGAATTGSGRYLTGDFIGADVVINEITAQATGAAIVNPKVDTIFEVGGQDSKYISLSDGVVVDFEMNHACAAGTGSFLEEQAQRLGINIKEEFAQRAFASKAPIKLGERCTVFMESDLLTFLQQGAATEELVAGLSYSIVTNYLNRVVGRRKIGENICFQGGTAFNKAVWAAFEQVTGKPVMVPDHHEQTGALGAAAIAAEYMKGKRADSPCAGSKGSRPASSFRGFENLAKIKYTVETFGCEHCPNNCEIKKVELTGSEPLYYGSRCDRYNLKKRQRRKSRFEAFEYRKQMLFECAGLRESQVIGGPKDEKATTRSSQVTIGIPLALSTWQLLPLFARFFKALGFEVVVSGESNKRTIRTGVESVAAQTCFPVKIAYGHIAELINKGCDYVFLPSIVSMPVKYQQNPINHLCPYVQTLPYQIKATFENKLGKTKILTAPIRLGEGEKLLQRSLAGLGKQLNVSGGEVRKALRIALSAQADFEEALQRKGRAILSKLGAEEKLFVLVSRPYNGCDAGMNLQLPKKLGEMGAEVIPMDMLDLGQAELTDPVLHGHLYWTYGQDILRAAEIIRRDRRLYGIYLSNFSCGPDSFLVSFFKDIMGRKPCLQLELDEHSADAGVITRLEAYFESLKHYRPGPSTGRLTAEIGRPVLQKSLAEPDRLSKERKLYIPWMGDISYSLAACFRGHGQAAEVLPIADEIALLYGRELTTGKECLPCTVTSGDMVKMIRSADFNREEAAFFMPSGSGPCRFGMYYCLHQLILRQVGAQAVPIIAPNQDSDLYNEFRKKTKFRGGSGVTKKTWIACVGAGLIQRVMLRIRPYAVDRRQAQMVYEESLERWNVAVEACAKFSQMRRVMGRIAERFAAVELDRTVRKPRIGIVGEVYVRSHNFANQHVIERLEGLGAACDLTPFAEWIYYTNWTRQQKTRRKGLPALLLAGELRKWLSNFVEDLYQHKTEKAIAAPLEEKFGPLVEEPIGHVLELARSYIDPSFEGEAILSVGKTIEYYHAGFGGVVNVMPFTCMPSTIVSTQTPTISRHLQDMPILNLSFDGQTDPTLTTRLEAFVEHVREREAGNLTVRELIGSVR